MSSGLACLGQDKKKSARSAAAAAASSSSSSPSGMLRSLEASQRSSELLKLCQAGEWQAAQGRAKSHPSEALVGLARPSKPAPAASSLMQWSSPSCSPSRGSCASYSSGCEEDEDNESCGSPSSGNSSSSSSSWACTPLSVACRGGAPMETVQHIAEVCEDQLLVSHVRRGTVLHDAIKHRAPLNVVSYIVESQKRYETCNRQEGCDGSTNSIFAKPEALLSRSVFDQRDYLGRTPLHHMMERACHWIVDSDTAEGGVSNPDSDTTPSSTAGAGGRPTLRWRYRDMMMSVIQKLVSAHPDAATAPDLDGQTPLSIILTIPASHPPDVGIELRILEVVRILLASNPFAALGKCQRTTTRLHPSFLTSLYGQDQNNTTNNTPSSPTTANTTTTTKTLSHTPLSCALTHSRSIVTVNLLLRTAPQAAFIPVGHERELPLHIAITMRAPVETIALLLEAAPCSAIVRDRRGLTPLCWCWIRCVLDHTGAASANTTTTPTGEGEYGQGQGQGQGGYVKVSKRRYIPRNYPELMQQTMNDPCLVHVQSREDVTKHVTLGPFWDKVELLLRAAHHGEIGWQHHQTLFGTTGSRGGGGIGKADKNNYKLGEEEEEEETLIWRPVHAATALCCPRFIVKLALKLYPQHVMQRDQHYKLPLHYAAARPPYRPTLPLGIFHEPYEMVEEEEDHIEEEEGLLVETHENGHGRVLEGSRSRRRRRRRRSRCSCVVRDVVALYPQAARVVDGNRQLPLHIAVEHARVMMMMMDEGGGMGSKVLSGNTLRLGGSSLQGGRRSGRFVWGAEEENEYYQRRRRTHLHPRPNRSYEEDEEEEQGQDQQPRQETQDLQMESHRTRDQQVSTAALAILDAYTEALERRDGKTRLYPFMQAAAAAGSCVEDGGSSSTASLGTIFLLLRECPTLVGFGVSAAWRENPL